MGSGPCLDCDLAVASQSLRDGGVPDVSSLVSAVQSGSLGKKPRARSADQDSASPGDALSVLFGNVSARGVVQHKGLVDSLAEEFDCAADVTIGPRKRSSTSQITQAPHAPFQKSFVRWGCARESVLRYL